MSRIRARLSSGSAVTTLKNTVDHVVAEYGVAKLRGGSIRQRTRKGRTIFYYVDLRPHGRVYSVPTPTGPVPITDRMLAERVLESIRGAVARGATLPQALAPWLSRVAPELRFAAVDLGATSIDVVDGHGSGNPDPDLLLDKLDTHATMVSRDRPFDPYVDLVAPNLYEAVVLVGMHAKAGSKGFASHSSTIGMEPWMNGSLLSEPEGDLPVEQPEEPAPENATPTAAP